MINITFQNGYFSFIKDGVNIANNVRNDVFAYGNVVDFKTSEGAVISRDNVSDVLVDGVPVSNVPQLFSSLYTLGYFDWIGSGGGGSGGVDRFTELLDAFGFTGNNGKVPVVNESLMRLDAVNLWNYKQFTELQDVAINELVEGKFVTVAMVEGELKVVLGDIPSGVDLTGFMKNPIYDETTRIFSAEVVGGESLEIELPGEKKVSRGLISGDSTIAPYLGQLGVGEMIVKKADLDAENSFNSIAVPGDTIAVQQIRWNDVTDKDSYDWIIVQVGLNSLDLALNTILTQLQTYIDSINASKKPTAKVIIGTMIPCKARLDTVYGNIGYANWLAVNDAIMGRGNTPIVDVDYRVDSHYYALRDPLDNLAQNFDTGDNIHENDKGRMLIAEGYRQILKQAGFLPIASANTIIGEVVHTQGNETIFDEKTFKGRTVIQANNEALNVLGNSASAYSGIGISGNDSDALGNKMVLFQLSANRDGALYNYAAGSRLRFGANDRYAFQINADGTSQSLFPHIVPNATDNTHAVNLGQVIPYRGKFTTGTEPAVVEGSIYFNTTTKLFRMAVFTNAGTVSWQDIMPYVNTYAVNSTTVGLTKAQLNAQYPLTPVNFRVIAGQITLGGAIYTRRTVGASGDWLMSNATPVM